jgi:hypothetical protein
VTAAVYGTSTIKRTRRTRAEIEALENAIYEVVVAERPCTIRGVFYRITSKGLVPKTEPGYRQVQNRVLVMRRRGDLPYGWISDGTRWRIRPKTFSGISRALENAALSYRRALWDDQDVHLEIWSEKDAIRSVIHPVTAEFDVPLMVARGFASESFLWETAQEIIDDGKPAVIYQLGDHDPSGVAAWEHTQRRLTEFAPGVDFQFERLAVTPAQIIAYNLPTRPTKTTDSRAGSFAGESVEVDALPSTILRHLVQEAIEFWVDDLALRVTKIAEESEREVLHRIAGEWVDP